MKAKNGTKNQNKYESGVKKTMHKVYIAIKEIN